jgi:hypothetical protein
VREYVNLRKQAMGLLGREVFVPQSYQFGGEAQVDWYEAWADFDAGGAGLSPATPEFDGQRRKVYHFCMRSMASGAAFHRAYPHATQQAFLEAHELAFRWFGGVFRTLRYDNLASAVKKILRGHQREETTRLIAFRSHWGFRAEFCTPGEGHEKGGVEGEGGQYRRNHLVPVPQVRNLEALNRLLEASSLEEQNRMIAGRSQTIFHPNDEDLSLGTPAARRCWPNAGIFCRWPRKDSIWQPYIFPRSMPVAASRC